MLSYLISFFNYHSLLELLKYFVKSNPDIILDKNKYFPDHQILENNWEIIKKECQNIKNKYKDRIPAMEQLDSKYNALSDNTWKVFFLRLFNNDLKNGDLCPETMKLIKQCKGIKTAFFSTLKPKTRLNPHEGEYLSIYRYHLGLIIPEPDKCFIRIKDNILRWKEGEGFMFDDTHTHGAINNGDTDRTILFLDIERNDLSIMARIIDYIIDIITYYHPVIITAINKSEPQPEKFDLD
jgi:beta-hydroxylase